MGHGLAFLGLPAWEALGRFEAGCLHELACSLYNRGDAGELTPEAFQKLLVGVAHCLGRWTGTSGTVRRSTRLKREGAPTTFMTEVLRYIAAGLPLVWSVIVGKVPEQSALPQATGGHLRLLIGWNQHIGEVLATDSWGAGHELQPRALVDAWAITTGLYGIKPPELQFQPG